MEEEVKNLKRENEEKKKIYEELVAIKEDKRKLQEKLNKKMISADIDKK